MKKIITLFSILILSLFIASCKEKPVDTMNELSEETSIKIKKGYINCILNKEDYSLDQVEIKNYFGKYGNSYAVIVVGGLVYATDCTNEIIDDVTISYPECGPYIHIYNDGKLYRLKDSLEKGLITKEDLYEIVKRYKKVFPHDLECESYGQDD